MVADKILHVHNKLMSSSLMQMVPFPRADGGFENEIAEFRHDNYRFYFKEKKIFGIGYINWRQ